MSDVLADADRWLKRAEELRLMADKMTDPEARRAALRIANGYDLLAQWRGHHRKPDQC